MRVKSIGRTTAIWLSKSEWWRRKTPDSICRFQFRVKELSLPFAEFHKAVEAWLGRPVWTHEFADLDRLWAEAHGKAEAQDPLTSLHRVAPDVPVIAIPTPTAKED